jgi:hypothetical protein
MRQSVVLLLFCAVFLGEAFDTVWSLKNEFAGSADDHNADNVCAKCSALKDHRVPRRSEVATLGCYTLISDFWTVDSNDLTHGFAGAYEAAHPGGNNLYIDEDGYLVLQPTCSQKDATGGCIASWIAFQF